MHLKQPSFLRSLRHAWRGIRTATRTQRNFRLHLAICLWVVTMAYLTALSALEWAVLLVMMALVLAAELLNTAIEYTVDWLAQGEIREEAKRIKDLAAAAVLICATVAVGVGLFIFLPHW